MNPRPECVLGNQSKLRSDSRMPVDPNPQRNPHGSLDKYARARFRYCMVNGDVVELLYSQQSKQRSA